MLVVIVVFLILLNSVETKSDFSLLDYFSGEYVAYTSQKLDDSVDLGFCYMNVHPVDNAVVGESMVILNFEIGSALDVLNANVVKTEYLQDGTSVIYAYTKLINQKVEVDGKKVNLQIATKDEKTTIGWPLILGSY